jgi:hypothetical protein
MLVLLPVKVVQSSIRSTSNSTKRNSYNSYSNNPYSPAKGSQYNNNPYSPVKSTSQYNNQDFSSDFNDKKDTEEKYEQNINTKSTKTNTKKIFFCKII